MLNKDKLAKYLNAQFNVLLEGSHGLGKTAIIKEVFEAAGLKWKYFSAATMDPWIDFIGVPKTVLRDGVEVLELIKPQEFANDEVDAIFFDELNRAPPKVINAVMELIQFKSINGKKFNNLKVVWAAINPYDEEGTYSVEKLDPATKDRFHIQITIPLQLDTAYLVRTYGEVAKPFIAWWNDLGKDLQMQVSPRRLDYAIQVHLANGDLRDALPATSNVKKLETEIKSRSRKSELDIIFNTKDTKKWKDFFTLERTIKYADEVLKHKAYYKMIPFFHRDVIEDNIQKHVPNALTVGLIQEAINNSDFYNSLSKTSQGIVDQSKDKGLLRPVHMDHQIQKTLELVIQKYAHRSVPMLISHVYPVFETYVQTIKAKKSTDIVSFMEQIFTVTSPDGKAMEDTLIGRLLSYKTMQPYAPATDGQALFLGILLNFAYKRQKEQKKSVAGFEEMFQKIHKFSIKQGKTNTRRPDLYIRAGFDESSWPDIRDMILKKPSWESITSTIKMRDIIALLKKPTSVAYRAPASLDDAKIIFTNQTI